MGGVRAQRGTACARGTGQHELPHPKHLPPPCRATGPLSEPGTSEEMFLWKPWESPHCLVPPSWCPGLGGGVPSGLCPAAEPLEPGQRRAEQPGDAAHHPSGQFGANCTLYGLKLCHKHFRMLIASTPLPYSLSGLCCF